MNRRSMQSQSLASRVDGGSALAWSPDGKSIAFVSRGDNPEGDLEIFTIESDGSDQTQLTRNEVLDSSPVWSPNGKRIAFVSHLHGRDQIFTMEVDGSGQSRLTNNEANDTGPAW